MIRVFNGKKYFDAHAHIAIYDNKYGDVGKLIQYLKENGLEKVVDCGIDIETSKKVLGLYRDYPKTIIPSIGLQPEVLVPGGDFYDKDFDIDDNVFKLESLLKSNIDVVGAVGECGLDYYWLEKSGQLSAGSSQLTSKQIETIKKRQVVLFEKQIDLGINYKLPLVIHSRGAENECLQIVETKLEAYSYQLKAVLHSFTGTSEVAKKVLKAGHYISFNGILTYSKAEEIRDIFKYAWKNYRNQILFETDSPYLVPSNRSGKTWAHERGERMCVPSYVSYTIEYAAGLLEVEASAVNVVNNKNSSDFFSV